MERRPRKCLEHILEVERIRRQSRGRQSRVVARSSLNQIFCDAPSDGSYRRPVPDAESQDVYRPVSY